MDRIGEDEIEAGRLLFEQQPKFMLGVARIDQLPDTSVPEIATAGRSNVGKSSLINALIRQHDLARTSNTPGRTQQLNFFDLGGRLRLVDLPGYGFAKAPKAQVDTWNELIRKFLRGRPNLRLVMILVDARHGIKPPDIDTIKLLGTAAVPFQIVLTKADLVSAAALAERCRNIDQDLAETIGALPGVLTTSARKNLGLDVLRAALAGYALPKPGCAQPKQ